MCLCNGDRIEIKSNLCRACYIQLVAKTVEYFLPNFLELSSCSEIHIPGEGASVLSRYACQILGIFKWY